MASTVPEVAIAIDALHGAGARRVLLSGSGSCVFTLAPAAERIEAIASRLHLPVAYAVYKTQFGEYSRVAMTAIGLAGGPPDDVAAQEPGAPNKAFVRVAGIALVERVIAALRSARRSGASSSLHTEACARTHRAGRRTRTPPDGVRITESLRSGLAGLPPDELVLVAASDLPVLTAASIEEFIAGVRKMDADLVYGCVEKSVHMSRYPEIPEHVGTLARRHVLRRRTDGHQTACAGIARTVHRAPRGCAKIPVEAGRALRVDTLARYAAGPLAIARPKPGPVTCSARRCARTFRRTPRPASTSTALRISPSRRRCLLLDLFDAALADRSDALCPRLPYILSTARRFAARRTQVPRTRHPRGRSRSDL